MKTIHNNYEQYLQSVLQLHPKWYELTTENDSEKRADFASLSIVEKLTWFPQEFQDEVNLLYSLHQDYERLSHKIALSVYQLHLLTQKSYSELQAKLELAFGKQLSKSYFSKLLSAGEVLTKCPDLSSIKDIEKLAALGRVKDAELIQKIADENKLASLSRNVVQTVVQKSLGNVIPFKQVSEKERLLNNIKLNLSKVDDLAVLTEVDRIIKNAIPAKSNSEKEATEENKEAA